MADIIWKDRKRIIFGLPWTFTKYRLTEEKFTVEKGFLNTTEEEIRLYRIVDMALNISLPQRLFGLGTIHICSMDKSTPEFDIKSIKAPKQVRDLISELVENERARKGVISREYMDNDDLHSES